MEPDRSPCIGSSRKFKTRFANTRIADDAVKTLHPLVVEAQSLRSEIEKSQASIWDEKLPTAYQSAVSNDDSSTGWKEAQKRDAKSADLMAKWNELATAIRTGPSDWGMLLDEVVSRMKTAENDAHAKKVADLGKTTGPESDAAMNQEDHRHRQITARLDEIDKLTASFR